MAEIQLDRLTKVYPDGTRAVRDWTSRSEDGEFVVFVGPSGCGKTTRAADDRRARGHHRRRGPIGDKVVNDLPPKDRDIAMIFQNYALYPHMSAYDNMAFGLKMRGLEPKEIDRRVRDAARVLGLADVLRKRPRTSRAGSGSASRWVGRSCASRGRS